jgi:hypothetical protein
MNSKGLTRLEHFSAMALQGVLSNPSFSELDVAKTVSLAREHAHEMERLCQGFGRLDGGKN